MTLKKPKINNKGLPSHKRLSVQISLTGHSFLITHTVTKEVLFFSETSFDHVTTPQALLELLKKELHQNNILEDQFDEIVLVHANDIATVVPSSLFDEQKAAEYLKFNSKILATDFITHDQLNTQELSIVYTPYVNINNFFFETFGSFSYFHATTKLLDGIINTSNVKLENSIHLHVFQDHFTCIIIKNSQLQLCNSYTYKTPEDFSYYILFCYEQLGLQPEKDPIILSGAIRENDDLYSQLFTYVRHIRFDENTKGLQIKETPKHIHKIISNL